jgi:hypothetical protein
VLGIFVSIQLNIWLIYCWFGCDHRGLKILSNSARWINVMFCKCCWQLLDVILIWVVKKVKIALRSTTSILIVEKAEKEMLERGGKKIKVRKE